MKTDINTILKKGVATKVKFVDYSTPEKKKELQEVRRLSEQCLKNKEVNWYKMSQIIINV